jgi:hypothetical protein
MSLRKGNPIRLEEVEIGKAYSIAHGGVAFFVVLEKNEDGVKVDYPKHPNQKYRIQTLLFADHKDKPIAGTLYFNRPRYQWRKTINYIITSNSIHN